MKIGILTFHNAHNYGAVLQAYALKKVLSDRGHEVTIINYQNVKIKKNYNQKLQVNPCRREIVFPWRWRHLWRRYLENKYAQACWEVQWKKFEEFISEVLLDQDTKIIEEDQISKSGYDAIICGSDQIWNRDLTGGLDKVYYLDFQTDACKIAYAVSVKNLNSNAAEFNYMKKCLQQFQDISTREELFAKKLTGILNREVKAVLDPTLLLESHDYHCLEQKAPVGKDYVFAYFVHEDSKLQALVKKLAVMLGMEFIELHYYFRKWMDRHTQRADLGPGEFLHYMRNARYVVTNSFHGTAFSIIYNKQFYSVYDEDMRKNELLKKLDLQKRHIKDVSQVNIKEEIDYGKVNYKLQLLKEESFKYLDNSLAKQKKGS